MEKKSWGSEEEMGKNERLEHKGRGEEMRVGEGI